MTYAHSFHIPVMGIGFTIDSPLKVAHLGIDSVISLVDDILLEKLRKMYCGKFDLPYQEISDKMEDFRAKRITSYLDMVNGLAQTKFEEFKHSTTETANDIKSYFTMLPDSSTFKQEFYQRTQEAFHLKEIATWVKDHMPMGSIDVNIMTKVDKENYVKKVKLSSEYNDAHAALRGFANSKLESSVVLSAGMNPRLYAYMEQFNDFYPDANGKLKKKIVLKVSDYRSALIQGKFLAKKGLWVSEYRIESGLNCGGHAFATDGYLMGPILQQFKENREELVQSVFEVLAGALKNKDRHVPKRPLPLLLSAQGGVGTSEEHDFLMEKYSVDSVGWGSAFLLVPEATTVDKATLDQLVKAEEDDLYLSNTSPLGIPFHSLKGNTKDKEKAKRIADGKPGSPCPKKFVALNKDIKEKGLCTASRQYQAAKLKQLEAQGLSKSEFEYQYNKITEKSCTCVGLGTAALLAYNLDTKVEGDGVSICPGPNMAYFSKITSLKDMIDHVYGRANVISRINRPNMFIKELQIYLEYYKEQIDEFNRDRTEKRRKQLITFASNLLEGISYYEELFVTDEEQLQPSPTCMAVQLHGSRIIVNTLLRSLEIVEKLRPNCISQPQ
ncbi:hypothetical protein ACFQZJ_07370 [Maribacter chungangensis]|uniref:Uncharacterized protein n=1 Tax=Maribacter chungangensis TaxID=1069117 RepID=A0ABW3B2N9_9FLAO